VWRAPLRADPSLNLPEDRCVSGVRGGKIGWAVLNRSVLPHPSEGGPSAFLSVRRECAVKELQQLHAIVALLSPRIAGLHGFARALLRDLSGLLYPPLGTQAGISPWPAHLRDVFCSF